MRSRSELHSRLKNCLQTILELEPALERVELRERFEHEFAMLKSYLEHLEQFSLKEDDVLRIEKATTSFLDELREPLLSLETERKSRRLLQ